MISPGIHVYSGCTRIGKTYKAIEDLQAYHKATGLGCLVIDSGRAKNFREWQHAQTMEEAVSAVWERREICAWTPRDIVEFETMMRAVEEGGGILLLVDEIGFWPNSKNFLRLCRVWGHSEVTILVTAQHVSADLGPKLLACDPTFYFFKSTSPRSLEWIEEWHSLDVNAVLAQTTGQYIEKRF